MSAKAATPERLEVAGRETPTDAAVRYVTEGQWFAAASEFANGARARGIVTSQSPAREKLALYRSLFRGREDVHAHGYLKKDGGIGYAPACANEWERGVCPRTAGQKVKCADCPHQVFLPLDDATIVGHFKGEDTRLRDVIGLYVLDADSNTNVLVLDFDDAGWREAVRAVRAAAASLGVPAHVERSRSGNGAHVWFFFEAPTSAKLARAFGNAVLEEAMALSKSVGFSAFDRMFPAQETIPAGGFGNLIAAPFQGRAQRAGNSVFVDENFEPYPDQWLYLSQVRKFDEDEVRSVVDAAGTSAVSTAADSNDSVPWKPAPRAPLSPGDFPNQLVIIEADMLYVPEQGLSARAAYRIRRLAAFSNPEFFKRQALHRSVYGTPCVVYLGETRGGHIALPRGCKGTLISLLNEAQASYVVRDERRAGRPLSIEFTGRLRPEQLGAAERLAAYESGILSAPTGFGKTVIGAHLIARAGVPALVIVPKTALVSQWVERLGQFLSIEHPDGPALTKSGRPSKRKRRVIGQLGGGKSQVTGIVDVATYQSLVEKDSDTGEPRAKDLVGQYGLVICDECHHAAAPQLELILKAVPARLVYGLSATPRRADGLDRALYMLCGPVRCRVDPKDQARQQGFKRVLSPRLTRVRLTCEPGASFAQVLDELCAHAARNELIAKDVAEAVAAGRKPLVLTKRKGHARKLAELIGQRLAAAPAPQAHLLVGEGTARQRRERLAAALEAMLSGPAVLVATEAYLGEGFDASELDMLFLATPISWDGNVTQQAGRLHRASAGKTEVVIRDYVDAAVPMLERMYKRRLKTYARLGYTVESPGGEADGAAASFVLAGDAMGKLLADIEEATSSIALVAPYASAKSARVLAGPLADAKRRGVQLACVVTKSPTDEARAAFAEEGVELQEGSSVATSGLAVFDRKRIWYGTVPLLAFPKSDDCSIRLESPEAAHDLLEGLSLASNGLERSAQQRESS